MKRKKKLMQHFLTAMKESAIDCIFNYEEKEKCLSFPLPKSGINPHKTHRSNLRYKDDAYETIKVRKPTPSVNTNDERGEYIDAKKPALSLKTKYVKIDGKSGLKRKVGIDFSKSPHLAFDLKTKNRVGVIEKQKDDSYLLKPDDL